MKAIILPTGNTELLKPLNNWIPEFMIPVANKPVVEHLIEFLVRHNIKDIILVLKHMPYEAEQYFEKGLRWGCNITYSLEGEFKGIFHSLRTVQSRIDGSFLCLPWNIVTDLNFSAFVDLHEEKASDITIPDLQKWNYATDINESYPFIMTSNALTMLSNSDVRGLGQIISLSSSMGLTVNTFSEQFNYETIHNVNDYLEINKLVLRNKFNGINIDGKQIKSGIWVDRQARIHPSVKISPPALIGKLCDIRNGTHIGPDTIVGDNVIVDRGVTTDSSIIFNDTYIGSHTEIKDSIIYRNSLFHVPRLLDVYIGDDFILGDLAKKVIISKIERFFNIGGALLLLVLCSPVILLLLLYSLIFRSNNYLDSEERYGGYEVFDLWGNIRPKTFQFYFFRSKYAFIAKLPGLINVIKGDINLVGNSLLTHEEVDSLKEEWETMRFKAPAGLFHMWEIERNKDITWEEKIISENYYASTRSFMGDLKLLPKIIFGIGS